VPALLLQPLVENAIRHGLEPQVGPGTLSIRAEREGETLLLNISDNGAGLPKVRPLREGIGLANTRARLRELYGQSARLELRNENGWNVRVTLPYRMAV